MDNARERKLLGSYLPLYLTHQAEKKLHKFWPIVAEAFLQDYPEETRLGFNKATATPEQWTALKDAIEARKRRIATWFRYQKKKIATTPVARRKSENSLASTLFNPKPARRQRNGSLINEEVAKHVLEKVGDALGDMAMDVDESDEVRAARIKAGKSERGEGASGGSAGSEHEAIAATIQKERDELSLSSSSSLSPVEAAEARSVEEKQLAIDESNDVVEKVLQALGVQTDGFSFCIWGGPNPRLNGNLSLKCATYGETPAGNDFIAQHATFEESISEQFQVFLRRCFVDGDRRPSLMTPNEASQGVPELGDDVLATASASPPVQAKEKTKKGKHRSRRNDRSTIIHPPTITHSASTWIAAFTPLALSACSVSMAHRHAATHQPIVGGTLGRCRARRDQGLGPCYKGAEFPSTRNASSSPTQMPATTPTLRPCFAFGARFHCSISIGALRLSLLRRRGGGGGITAGAERKAPARADAQYIPKTTKLTRAQQLAAKNDGCLEKLLARGKKNAAPAASEELSTKRKAKGRKNLAGSLG
ncbi:hypothetical protein B0H13DRAFT_1928617 [Mycena leptocephala]|nr:hypothetical protein B0H13DRAFT_1928617 [Mycena leptocephala]